LHSSSTGASKFISEVIGVQPPTTKLVLINPCHYKELCSQQQCKDHQILEIASSELSKALPINILWESLMFTAQAASIKKLP
jgi:hypothetical protein